MLSEPKHGRDLQPAHLGWPLLTSLTSHHCSPLTSSYLKLILRNALWGFLMVAVLLPACYVVPVMVATAAWPSCAAAVILFCVVQLLLYIDVAGTKQEAEAANKILL